MQWSFISVPDLFNFDYADLSGGADPAIAAVFSAAYADTLIAAPNWQQGGPNSMTPTLAAILHQVVDDMVATAGGDPALVMIAGDLIGGRWPQNPDALNALFGDATTSLDQDLRAAADSYYAWIRTLFRESGVDTVVAAIGDHDIGDNAWKVGSIKAQSVPVMKAAFNTAMVDPLFAGLGPAEKALNDPWAGIRFGPGDAAQGSYVFQQNNVLFLTVDMFRFEGADVKLGKDGAVGVDVAAEHARWIRAVLERAEADDSIDHVIIQGHAPVLGPVRVSRSSGLKLAEAEFSGFWQTIAAFGTDNGGKVRAFLNGEVHASTTVIDAASGIVQISHGGLIEPSNFRRDDPAFLAVNVHEERLIIREYRIELEDLEKTSTIWQVDRPATLTHDTYLSGPVQTGRVIIDASSGALDLVASGSLRVAATANSREAVVETQDKLDIALRGLADGGTVIVRDGSTDLTIDLGQVSATPGGGVLRTTAPASDADAVVTVVMPGSGGNDRVFGGQNRDIVSGGEGLDRLLGRADADVFVFSAGTTLDIVFDFTDGEDRIYLDGIAFEDLTISSYRGDDTLLQAGSDRMILRDVAASDVTADDFAPTPDWFLT